MNPAGPTWSTSPEQFAGDIGVALALDRAAWEQLGAHFFESEEGLGETVRIAAGTIGTGIGEIEFGILDYGGNTTYLLASASGAVNQQLTAVITDALTRAGVLSSEDIMDEQSPFADEESLAQRVAVLEQWAGETVADATTTAVPVAMDVEIPAGNPHTVPTQMVRFRVAKVGRYPHGPPAVERHIGTIKSFDADKGFGVIEPQGGGKEVFLTADDIVTGVECPDIGKTVTFRYGLRPKADEETRTRPGYVILYQPQQKP